ncbi:MAG: NAD-dependent epimerase/dehydratase family protein [Gemmatimonadota bacterium]|nr:NAD-dependent epimerase/dehydratase family protein [Gemmatimonadota bacterium]
MSRILLTGATGFLGSHIAEALVEAGHGVRCSVRATSDTRWIDGLLVEKVELDLGAPETAGPAREALDGVDVVVHCGGLTRARDEAEFLRVNARGTERLDGAEREAGVERFLLISSLVARGPDGADGPISPYGRSKREGERALERAGEGMEAVVLRPGGIYGPRDSDLMPLFAMAARGWIVVPRSEVPLQPVFVADVVSAVMAALEAPVPDRPIPVAGAERHGWDELAAALARAVGREGRVLRVPPPLFWAAGLLSELASRVTGRQPAMDRRRARDMSHHAWTCDIDPARRALGWEPEVGVDEGLERTAAWYRAEGWL